MVQSLFFLFLLRCDLIRHLSFDQSDQKHMRYVGLWLNFKNTYGVVLSYISGSMRWAEVHLLFA